MPKTYDDRRTQTLVNAILRFNAERDPELVARKYCSMRANAFAFLRGSCHLFYGSLPKSKLLKNAPLAWVCGDLHLENFGSYKGGNRLVYFDLNDLDEAALAPCTWDLLRFVTSVLVGGATLKLGDAQAQTLALYFLTAYVSAIRDGKVRWIERDTAQGMVGDLLNSLRRRKRKDLLNRFTVRRGDSRCFKLDEKTTLPIAPAKRTKVEAFMRRFAQRQADQEFYRVLDVARRIAGNGSLGVERYVLLIEGKGSPDGNYLLDMKQALPSSLTPALRWKQPKWSTQAQRVLTLQRQMQAVSMAFLDAASLGQTAFVLRGLQPSEDRLSLDKWKDDITNLETVMSAMGQLTAWAHLRSSGRKGAAVADELMDFWGKADHTAKLLRLASQCKAQVERDWALYSEAYDRGDVTQVIDPARRPTTGVEAMKR